jgi:DNA-directed RNA polymerase subunit H (RpoH/RPB5)
MGLCPRLNCVYRDARGILQRFDFDETNLPLLLAKDPVVKK